MNQPPIPDNLVHIEPKASSEGLPSFPHTRPTESGIPKVLNTADNLATMIDFLGMEAITNQMTLEPEIHENGTPIADSLEVVRSKLVSAASIVSLPKAAIEDHLVALTQRSHYHPVKAWLDKGQWDKKERVEPVLACLNAQMPDISRIVMTRWLVGCVASLYEPNFKSKLVPILQGEQSFRKTAFIERLAKVVPDAFLEGAELNPDNKDSVLSCIRSWIVELGELERSTKNSQGALKAFLTKEIDTVRPPYGRADIKKPRQSHFIATVNGTDFLKDETGNARYAVIELTKPADLDTMNDILGWKYDGSGSIRLVKPEKLRQFWLEIKTLYESKYSWMLTAEEQKRVGLITDKHSDKGSIYGTLIDHVIYCENDKRRCCYKWMTAGQVCSQVSLPLTHNRPVGKALALLVKEGRIKDKLSRGRNLYNFPVIQSL